AYHDSIGFPVSEMESMLSMKVSTVIPYKYQQIQGYANRGLIMAERPLLKLNKYYRSVAHLIEPIFSKSELARHKGLKKGFVNLWLYKKRLSESIEKITKITQLFFNYINKTISSINRIFILYNSNDLNI